MTTRKVTIWIRYKRGGDWIMKKAQWAGNRRHFVPGVAKGARAVAEQYLYYLRYQRHGKRVTEPAGRDSIAAVATATTREIELFAAERTRSSKYNAYRLTLENFEEACPACGFLDQVTVDTLRAFVAWQRKSYDQNTLYCRFSELLAFLLKNGIEVHLSKGERPKKRIVAKDGTGIETYSDDVIRKLLGACKNERERLIVHRERHAAG